MEKIKVECVKEVFVLVYGVKGVDGCRYYKPRNVCDSIHTAQRLASHLDENEQISMIRPDKAFMIEGKWYCPWKIEKPSDGDIEAEREHESKMVALEKIAKMGLNSNDIEKLYFDIFGGNKE